MKETSRFKFASRSDLREHSQTTTTRQPAALSSASFRLSRARLAANFLIQCSLRLAGTAENLQPTWACQKQPCTKTATRYIGSTKSGFPGRWRGASRKRNPSACRCRRTISSGCVSRERIAAIIRDRTSGDTRSANVSHSMPMHMALHKGFRSVVVQRCHVASAVDWLGKSTQNRRVDRLAPCG